MQSHALPKPCDKCGSTDGVVFEQHPHMRLNCAKCGAFSKFVGKAELGLAPVSLTDRDGIKPGQRERIRERDANRCLLCGKSGFDGHELHVAHILSVAEGRELGASDDELNDDGNLFMCCAAHNVGQGRRSFAPRVALLILRCIRAQHRREEAA